MTNPSTAPPSVAAGPPLTALGALLGGPRVEDLLTRAAETAPERVALRCGTTEIRYAELDARAAACAAALAARVPGPDSVVALAMVLDPVFAVAYYAVARSGNISALVNPLLRESALLHVLSTARARAAIVPPELYRRLAPVLSRLPDLDLVVLTGRDPDFPELPTVPELVAGDAPPVPGARPAAPPEQAVACLQFTSGTTGAAKAVQLTHRNLVVNAAQTAYGHQLGPESVLFNYLPTFHLMHLNAGVTAAATHVLHPGEDPVEAAAEAGRQQATHFYTLPSRLTRLAAHPSLGELELPALRAILSGGSTLAAAPATALSQQFGVPVVQGFGLAETGPSATLGDLDRPKSGSSGIPVPGAEIRVVGIGDGKTVPLGDKGEIQVRGPQLMLGYSGRDRGQDFLPGGWFATGDVGLLDADGHLFVTDRIKDVFKTDNWLVCPSQIERVLLRHPAVSDCVVFDYPDAVSGAVAYAQVVLAQDASPEEIAASVNEQLPYYEHLKHVSAVDEIPRSPTGKVRRADLRAAVLAAK
ncbi:class I adenylate-forming enzyme family protein [Amycolatopsis sp. VC5-11]|uniref:class I adenylate-forming enzyme family protein n=1 Tax=Amycolatopsis sp. VC5-11 TaxID=3120156 RepID=UPI003009ECD3